MSQHPYDTRYLLRTLTGLDFGLHVRIHRSGQRTIFTGADAFSVEQLTSELAEMISSLRVYSYPLRSNLERVTTALQHNVESGSWRFARRAALDMSGILAQAGKQGLASRGLCLRGANAALRIADLCGRGEVR